MEKKNDDEHLTMHEFITAIVEESYDPKIEKALLRSLVFSVIGTLILLPFGRWMVSVPPAKTVHGQVTSIEDLLYSSFKTKLLEHTEAKSSKLKKKSEYTMYLDHLPNKSKAAILTLALRQPDTYQQFVKAESWRKKVAA